MKILGALLIFIPLVSACSTLQLLDNPTAAERANAEHLEILYDATDRPYKNLGLVRGSGCQKSSFDPTIPETDAIRYLKLHAARLSADAVMSTACRNVAIDWFTDCFKLTECTGVAIQFQDK